MNNLNNKTYLTGAQRLVSSLAFFFPVFEQIGHTSQTTALYICEMPTNRENSDKCLTLTQIFKAATANS